MQEQLPSAYLLPTKTVRTSFGSKLHVGYAVRTFSGQTARGVSCTYHYGSKRYAQRTLQGHLRLPIPCGGLG
jgi:hypothetical protein